MNEKLLLELLAKGRLSVDETLALMGKAEAPKAEAAKPIQRRNKPTQRTYGLNDHKMIIELYKAFQGDIGRVARNSKIPKQTVRNHLYYAGLIPCPSQDAAARVATWRRRKNMYVGQPIEIENAGGIR